MPSIELVRLTLPGESSGLRYLYPHFNEFVRLALLGMLLSGAEASSLAMRSKNPDRLTQEAVREVRAGLTSLLTRYCVDSCQLLNVDVTLEVEVPETNELGFESLSETSAEPNYLVSSLKAEVQIDDRVTSSNRDRLKRILENYLESHGVGSEVVWLPIQLPNIGKTASGSEVLKDQLEQRLSGTIQKVIARYCPEACTLNHISIDGQTIPLDEAAGLPSYRLVRNAADSAVLRVDQVDVEVSMDEGLTEELRDKIASVIKANTMFVRPLELSIAVIEFPESHSERKARELADTSDPYGLEKLRQMLTLFRELAGTKEIITNSTTASSETNQATLSEQTLSEKSLARESISKDQRLDQSTRLSEGSSPDADFFTLAVTAAAGMLLLIGLIGVMWLRSANRDAKAMMAQAPASGYAPSQGFDSSLASATNGHRPSQQHAALASASEQGARSDLVTKVKVQKLRHELVNIFAETPKIARETFGKMMRESGIEETGKYIHILGNLVIFELLDDPNLQRELYALSEFYHNSEFKFSEDETLHLLEALRTRVTASEIRVLSNRGSEKFDFLSRLSGDQIFRLVADELPQVQSIVLTQLDKKRRMEMFDFYQGESKMKIMNELCRADAVPKEYLANVAQALSRKVQSRPDFDTTNIRSSDILLDLLERANLSEQRRLMTNLQSSNAETARSLKSRLVTVEMLCYLKDGHLLEIILGLEREDLLSFLMGTRDHVRDLLLSKAPRELAESWMEDLRFMATVDETQYRIVEIKILGRIRNLASNGAINILDLNETIFADGAEGSSADLSAPRTFSRMTMVA